MVMSGCKSIRHEKSEAKLGTLLAHTTDDPGELCLLGPSLRSACQTQPPWMLPTTQSHPWGAPTRPDVSLLTPFELLRWNKGGGRMYIWCGCLLVTVGGLGVECLLGSRQTDDG